MRRERGFTLVELLMALAISMVGLLGLLALQMIAIRSNSNARSFSEATALAQEQLETLQMLTFTDLNALSGTTADPGNPLKASPGSTMAIYNRTTIITPGVLLSGSTSTKMEVDVTWADTTVGGKTHQVSLVDVRSQ